MSLQKFAKRIRRKLFPSQHELMVRKWRAEGGDRELRFNYDLGENSVVLDLGGYEGQWASDLFGRYRCRILIFEPVGVFADRIRRRFAKNDRIQVFEYGLGGCSRWDKIHVRADESSLFGDAGIPQRIEIVDVKDWLEGNALGRVDLMKVNIEGGEYELLDRLIETRLIEDIDNLQVQFHELSKSSRRHMEQIREALRGSHEAEYQYDFVWESWKRNREGRGPASGSDGQGD